MDVFIVDDCLELCRRLVGILSEIPGVRIIGQAQDVSSAKEGIKKALPDFVILDIRLRSESGLDVLKAIKSEPKYSPTVAIFTNYPYPQYRNRCMNMGADYFFDKSEDLDALVNLISERARGRK
jgi:DNA-binding NarL/FixJ family response regulator